MYFQEGVSTFSKGGLVKKFPKGDLARRGRSNFKKFQKGKTNGCRRGMGYEYEMNSPLLLKLIHICVYSVFSVIAKSRGKQKMFV